MNFANERFQNYGDLTTTKTLVTPDAFTLSGVDPSEMDRPRSMKEVQAYHLLRETYLNLSCCLGCSAFTSTRSNSKRGSNTSSVPATRRQVHHDFGDPAQQSVGFIADNVKMLKVLMARSLN
eukprot:TRINITY_DN10594_c0_g2_i3.p2 TRINITY_DN10594_c0_g2~~TRINITY_DN10594_c0_g2_i3.p2  ORF type:complete len:122 (+),score=4.18 TRINITY_DN10594_c0_g2_i3:443-808(+)